MTRLPSLQAYAEALHSFSKHVCDYSDAKDNNPEWAKVNVTDIRLHV